jgi:hypothetical protein
MINSLYISLAGSFKKRDLSEYSEAEGIIVNTMVTSDELFTAKSLLKAATGDMQ